MEFSITDFVSSSQREICIRYQRRRILIVCDKADTFVSIWVVPQDFVYSSCPLFILGQDFCFLRRISYVFHKMFYDAMAYTSPNPYSIEFITINC